MLCHPQPGSAGQDLRRSMGWLSALAGNLALALADHTAPWIHLGTSARLGTAAGDDELVCWSLGAQAMTANADGRHARGAGTRPRRLRLRPHPAAPRADPRLGRAAHPGRARRPAPRRREPGDGHGTAADDRRPARRTTRPVQGRGRPRSRHARKCPVSPAATRLDRPCRAAGPKPGAARPGRTGADGWPPRCAARQDWSAGRLGRFSCGHGPGRGLALSAVCTVSSRVCWSKGFWMRAASVPGSACGEPGSPSV